MIFIIILVLILFQSSSEAQTLTPSWKYCQSITDGVNGHRSLTLPDGNILIVGGENKFGSSLNEVYLYEYATNVKYEIAPMSESRMFHSLVAVSTGAKSIRVFAIGGYSGSSGNYKVLASIEYLDYSVGQKSFQWKSAGSLLNARGDCSAAYDKNSLIVITGGFSQSSGAIRSGIRVKSTETINVNSLQIFQIADMNKARAGGLLGSIINENGQNQILTAGGEDPKSAGTELLKASSWDAFANPPKNYRDFSVNFVDFSGIARMFGGKNDANSIINSCEWYDVKSGWKYSPNMFSPRANANCTRIAGLSSVLNYYMVVGGENNSGKISDVEYFSPPDISNPSGAWIQFQPLNAKGANRTIEIGGHNLPLVIGGDNNGAIDGIEIFQPIKANNANFSAEEIGRISDSTVIKIKNEWLLPVKLTDFRIDKSAEFFFTGDTSNFTLQAGAERKIYVRFLPNDAGLRSSRLLFNIGGLIDTINLQGTGITSSIAIVTKNVTFGEIFVGKDTNVCFSAIKNNGTDTTYIDSISVSPKSDYTLISPIGKVKIAPNGEIQVCVKFHPSSRNSIFGSAILNLGSRKFPCSLDGKGIQKYIKGYVNQNCDTVSYAPNKTYQALITIQNPSDRDVIISKFNFSGGAANLFSYSGALPDTIKITGRKDYLIDFKPNIEGSFQTNCEAVNNGNVDSVVNLPICFVARSRNAGFVNSSVDFQTFCLGDSVTQEIIIENPSSYENLTIDSLATNAPISYIKLTLLSKNILSPRERASAVITFAPAQSGAYNYQLYAYTSNGKTAIPIIAQVKPNIAIKFQDSLNYAYIGDKITCPISLNWAGSGISINTAKLKLNYDESLLKLHRILTYDNGAQLDLNQSSFVRNKANLYDLSLKWINPLSTTSINTIGLEFETLLGSSDISAIEIESLSDPNYCFTSGSSTIQLYERCGGKGGLLSPKSYNLVSMQNNYLEKNIVLTLDKFSDGALCHQIYNTLGDIVLESSSSITKNSVKVESLNLDKLPNGVYLYRLIHNGKIVYNEKIILAK